MSLQDMAQEMADAGWSLERERDRWREIAEEQDETLAKVARALRLLDERAALLKTTTDDPVHTKAAEYFQGRNVGEMAGTAQAADALRRALGMDTP